MDRSKLDEIIAFTSDILKPEGFECIEVEWSGHDRILRVFVDALECGEGINLDGCVKASRLLVDLPELDEMVSGPYTLEVSSPGIERPLRSRAHFEQHIGETVQVRLTDKVQDRRNGKGRLLEVAIKPEEEGDASDICITLETSQGLWSFPLRRLQRATLVYDWNDH